MFRWGGESDPRNTDTFLTLPLITPILACIIGGMLLQFGPKLSNFGLDEKYFSSFRRIKMKPISGRKRILETPENATMYRTYDPPPFVNITQIPRKYSPNRTIHLTYIGNKEHDVKIPSENQIKNVILTSNASIVEFKDTFVTNEGIYIQNNTYYFHPDCHFGFNNRNKEKVDKHKYEYRTVEYGISIQHEYAWFYAHWIVDFLPSFFVLPSEIIKKSYVFVINTADYVTQALKLVGFDSSQIVVIDPFNAMFVHHLYSVSPITCVHFNANLILNMRKIIVRKLNLDLLKPYRYVMYNRDAEFRSMKNADEAFSAILQKFPKYNWEMFQIGGTISDQFREFNQILLFFSVHGAAFANTIFMQPNTVVAELQVSRWVDNYLWISAFTEHHHIIARDKEIKWRESGGKDKFTIPVVLEMIGAALTAISNYTT